MAYGKSDLKRLFGRSGGICAFPSCNEELIVGPDGDIRAHIAHIVARSDGGPRANPELSSAERNAYANLILLCPNHHAQVDARDGADWTIESLQAMKADHEKWIAARGKVGHPVGEIVSQLTYINVPRLSGLAILSGYDVDLSGPEHIRTLWEMGSELNAVMHAAKEILRAIPLNAVDLEKCESLDPDLVGATVKFDGEFRTKGVPSIEKVRTGRFRMKGVAHEDPHIYRNLSVGRLMLAIDPKWITTTTAWCEFKPSSGRMRFAGACMVKQVDVEAKTIIGSPLFIGLPKSPYAISG